MSVGSHAPCSAPSRQHSGSILGCLGSTSTLMDTLFPAHTDRMYPPQPQHEMLDYRHEVSGWLDLAVLRCACVPMVIRLMVSDRLGFSGSRIQVSLSISSRMSQNSVRDSKTSRKCLWSCSRVVYQTRAEQDGRLVTTAAAAEESTNTFNAQGYLDWIVELILDKPLR